MNKFDEKRFGYGVENPLIRKGAEGYFTNAYKDIRTFAETGNFVEDMKYGVLSETPSLQHVHAYENEDGYLWQFFYVVKEAPSW